MDIFERTIRGLEIGLKVGDVATFELGACSVDDDVREAQSRRTLSAISIRAPRAVVGVLERGESQEGRVADVRRPLDDSLLVAFDEPIKGFLPNLLETPYRLVVRGSQIDGIVTWSDVHKLPVECAGKATGKPRSSASRMISSRNAVYSLTRGLRPSRAATCRSASWIRSSVTR